MSITLYGEALLDLDALLQVRQEGGGLAALPTARWSAALDDVDRRVIDRLDGPTLDIGCGPGRFVTGVGERGLPSLGIDVAPAAVALTQRRGGLALHCDVYGRVPGTGRWNWALLMDGNIGIGGAPGRLLGRVAELLAPTGRIVVEVEPPGGTSGAQRVRLELEGRVGAWFPWAWVSCEDLEVLAHQASLLVVDSWNDEGRWFCVLAKSSPRKAQGVGTDLA